MNKKQMLNEIIDLYDENERLKDKLNNLFDKSNLNENDSTTEIDNLNKKAKELLFKEIFSSWRLDSNKVEVEEDSGEFNFLTFDQWYKKINTYDTLTTNYEYLCNELTGNQIKDYFYTQLREYFEKKVNDKKMEIVRSKKDE